MEWKRAKNIILCVLLFANIFLLINLMTLLEKRWGEQIDKALVAAENLVQRGHTVDTASIGRLPVSLRVYDVPRSSEYEKKLAESVLGKCEVKPVGGGIEIYFNDTGRFVFRSGGDFLGELYGRNMGENFSAGAKEIVGAMKVGSYRLMELDEESVFFSINAGGRYGTEDYGITVEQTTRGVQVSGKLLDTGSAERTSISPDYARALITLATAAENEGYKLNITDAGIVYVCDDISADESVLEPALRLTESSGEVLVNLNTMEITKK